MNYEYMKIITKILINRLNTMAIYHQKHKPEFVPWGFEVHRMHRLHFP